MEGGLLLCCLGSPLLVELPLGVYVLDWLPLHCLGSSQPAELPFSVHV